MSIIKNYLVSRSFGWYRNLFFLFMVLILGVSSIPSLPEPEIESFHFEIRLDYFFHFSEYFVLIFLGISWWHQKHSRTTFLAGLLCIMLFVMLLGVGDELHQKLIPGRTFNPLDALSNISGTFLGTLFAYFFWQSAKK